MSRSLMKHEAAHAIGSLISGAPLAVIKDDGASWVTTPVWPEGTQPGELATMTSYLAGPLCYPDCASSTDNFLLSVFKVSEPKLFDQISVLANDVVKPAVEGISVKQLDEWISRIEAGDEVYIRRVEGN